MEYLQQQLSSRFWAQLVLFIFVIIAMILTIVNSVRKMRSEYVGSNSKILKICYNYLWIAFSVFVIVLICQLPKYFRDMNRVLENNYLQNVFVVKYINSGDESSSSSITFVTQNDDEIRINISASLASVGEGDKYELLYLPYTRIGVIIRKIE